MKKSVYAAVLIAASASVAFTAQAQFAVTAVQSSKKAEKEQPVPTLSDPGLYDVLGTSKYVALYDYNVNTTDKGGAPVAETYVTALRIGDDGALFTDYLTYKSDSLIACGAPAQEIKNAADECGKAEFFFEPTVVQNMPEGMVVVYDQTAIKLATYSEPFGEIAWELTGETDSVAGYQASAAIGEYGGRKWKVWFTEEIPVTFDPWKLAGLPGLVLQADDSEGLLGFRLIQFTKSEVPLAIAKNANVVKTERDKFIRQKNSNLQNPMEAINPASISSMTVLKSANKSPRFVINGVNVRMPVNTCIPLELK